MPSLLLTSLLLGGGGAGEEEDLLMPLVHKDTHKVWHILHINRCFASIFVFRVGVH